MASQSSHLNALKPGAQPHDDVDASSDLGQAESTITEAAVNPSEAGDGKAEMEVDEDDGEDDFYWRYAPGPTFTENMELYQPGGLHPVQIEDCIEDRYHIVHKLGCGGSATVWLARDTEKERYVALKIVTANMSQCAEAEASVYKKLHESLPEGTREDFLLPLYDSFWIEGPNGKHMCLSMGISGPSLVSFRHAETMKIRPDLVNVVAAQVVEGLSEMHKVGLVYGDLSAGNIAFTMPCLDHFSVKQLYNIFGSPETCPVSAARQSFVEYSKIHAPALVYEPLSFTGMPQVGFLQPQVKFIDFGASYIAPGTNEWDGLGYTESYADPDCLARDARMSQESDMWALACIFFELRSAKELFPHDSDGVWPEILARLGPMPQSWEESEVDAESDTREFDDEEDDGDGEDADLEDVQEDNEALRNDESAERMDDMELGEQSSLHSADRREDPSNRPDLVARIPSFFPNKLNDLMGGLLMQRAASLMMRLNVEGWKQRCTDLLSLITSWFHSPSADETAPESPIPSPVVSLAESPTESPT